MGWVAGEIYGETWREQGDAPFVAGMPTGGTPVPLYNVLTGLFLEGELDFRNVHTFNLDEYMDIPPNHTNSYRSYMEDHLFRYVNIPRQNIHFLNGLTRDWRATCHRYEQRIRELGGIDLQFLGIGMNGHIAFNEPGTEPSSRTRMVRLSERTLQDNSRLFPDPKEAPRFALTMGIQTILEARKIVLLATGAGKANAVYESLCEPPSARVPASFLQNYPGHCVYVLDAAAAEELPLSAT
jgi:glucosamine-6-phosphate deaminase